MSKENLHHHFTKSELALEEILIIFIVCFMCVAIAWAAEALMPIRVNIVRCVTPQERIQMCEERSLCCHLVEKAQNPSLQSAPEAGDFFDNQQTKWPQGTYPDTYEGQTVLQ